MPILKMFGADLWSFLSSRFGQICLAFTVAWVWSGWRTDDHWRDVIAVREAAAQAAYRAEIARQATAAQEIAAAATARAEEDAAVERDLREQINAFAALETPHEAPGQSPNPSTQRSKAPACIIDGDFAGVVRRFDAAGRRAPRPSRAAR